MPSEFIKRQKNDFFRDLTSLGSLWLYLVVILYFLFIQNYALLKNLVIGLGLIYLIVVIIRAFYFKERPKKYSYNSFIERLDASSFPSLHAARAAFLFVNLAAFLNNPIFFVLSIILILMVAYSRIYMQKHDI